MYSARESVFEERKNQKKNIPLNHKWSVCISLVSHNNTCRVGMPQVQIYETNENTFTILFLEKCIEFIYSNHIYQKECRVRLTKGGMNDLKCRKYTSLMKIVGCSIESISLWVQNKSFLLIGYS